MENDASTPSGSRSRPTKKSETHALPIDAAAAISTFAAPAVPKMPQQRPTGELPGELAIADEISNLDSLAASFNGAPCKRGDLAPKFPGNTACAKIFED